MQQGIRKRKRFKIKGYVFFRSKRGFSHPRFQQVVEFGIITAAGLHQRRMGHTARQGSTRHTDS